ncbi:Uncharacterised protein [Aeromonas salmonicida]|uniref:hypothetical protein n=1 Tax=Aeromonas salmonicida TaxID=645 RepID=UPI001025903A|nr:hypothetical protein [Aeromonas salmonicida]VFB09262.1 Uncharacterised protein [Aeromonas salmonicida]
MGSTFEELKTLLNKYVQEVEDTKTIIDVTSTSCIDSNVNASPGVYWIETTMPVDKLQCAISDVLGKPKKIRASHPQGSKLIEQKDSEYYVVYSGTEENLNKRLKQHLFNQGHTETVKLGCVIDDKPFSDYKWRVSFSFIDSYEIRYAVEACWRLNKGWPKFCLR